MTIQNPGIPPEPDSLVTPDQGGTVLATPAARGPVMRPEVLIVDDALFVALDLEDAVAEAGYKVVGPCGSVSGTLTLIERQLPACAILDIRLVDGDVFPVADRLRDAGVPLIFHSGNADQAELATRYPRARFCAKPSRTAQLIEMVRQSID